MNDAAALSIADLDRLYALLWRFLIVEEQRDALALLNQVRDVQMRDPVAAREALREFCGFVASTDNYFLIACEEALTRAVGRRRREVGCG